MIWLAIFQAAVAAPQNNADSDAAHIITGDITRFWQAFDLLAHQQTTADSLHIIKTIIIDSASAGLQQYIAAANCDARCYLEAIRTKQASYKAIRAQTAAVAGQQAGLVRYLHKFRAIYPQLKIPTICLAIGKFQVGGTQFGNTLYIGCEVDALNGVDIAAQTIHEVAHYQQLPDYPQNNLAMALVEGGAEFMCYQVTGLRTIAKAWAYGKAHEQAVWQQFKPLIGSAFDQHWFLDIPYKGKPGSMAYFVGFRICEAYLARKSNKRQAIKDIGKMADPDKIYKQSLYTGR